METLTAKKDDIAGFAVASDERIEAYVLYVNGENCVAALFRRGRRRASEAIARAVARERCDEDLQVSEGPPGGVLEAVPGGTRLPRERHVCSLCSNRAPGLAGTERAGIVELRNVDIQGGGKPPRKNRIPLFPEGRGLGGVGALFGSGQRSSSVKSYHDIIGDGGSRVPSNRSSTSAPA